VEKAALAARSRELKQRIMTDKETRDRWLGVFIGVLALFLAICTMLGDNATKDANRLNIDASNNWNFFQAKNLRRHMLRLQIEDFEMQLAAQPDMPAVAREAITKRIAAHRDTEKLLTSDPKSGEGLDELFKKGKALEAERDLAFRKDPYFDWSQTFLQIAIVLASVCLITGTLWLLYLSIGLGAAGLLLLINGSTLLIPLLG
jgi:hypothetical protein